MGLPFLQSLFTDPALQAELIIYCAVVLAVFNMIPLPPFDGSRVAYSFLPPRLYFGVMKYERIIMLVVLVLFAVGIFDITPFAGWVMDLMLKLVNLIF